jgi:hypothetical protein
LTHKEKNIKFCPKMIFITKILFFENSKTLEPKRFGIPKKQTKDIGRQGPFRTKKSEKRRWA